MGGDSKEACDQRFLLIGYGNPGRRDDGLGPALAQAMETAGIDGLDVDSDYQLTVEDADAVARHEVVVFADASVNAEAPFEFKPIMPGGALGFSSHSVEPEALLMLAKTLFGKEPAAYVLGIRGYEFNQFGEGLSAGAVGNLKASVDFLKGWFAARRRGKREA